jgi:hypothetical protein
VIREGSIPPMRDGRLSAPRAAKRVIRAAGGVMKPTHPVFSADCAARFCSKDLHISTNRRAATTGFLQVHIGLCAPRMPTIRPYNAEKGSLKRPNLAEEISVFHRSILRHSRGGVTIADSIRLRALRGNCPGLQEAPPECRTSRVLPARIGHGEFISRHTVQRRLWRTRQAS